jgi:endonuclease-8
VARRLDGRRLEAARSHGKNLLLEFGDLVLHSHLGMTGSWQIYRRGERWRKPQRAAWLLLEGDQMDAVQFGGPALRIVPARALDRDPVLARLGPDILAADFDVEAVSRSLRSAGDRPVGEALLDQSAVAGIGNIFKSEACFAARVDPWRPVSGLSHEALESVLTHARSLMLDAVAGRRRPRTVYRQTGRPCPRCGTRIVARGQGDDNRSTYWCPGCQDDGSHPTRWSTSVRM